MKHMSKLIFLAITLAGIQTLNAQATSGWRIVPPSRQDGFGNTVQAGGETQGRKSQNDDAAVSLEQGPK